MGPCLCEGARTFVKPVGLNGLKRVGAKSKEEEGSEGCGKTGGARGFKVNVTAVEMSVVGVCGEQVPHGVEETVVGGGCGEGCCSGGVVGSGCKSGPPKSCLG